ncbi:uncharacterized protein FOBCDRAFT_198962 [Fusarium oxysporum Fo47]|uniref:DNA (cytosine-5)-methyltransferase 1 replication foci domain-containing protein n=1 Tax=Fusarium oxysporum Fo47 TaxID=660027 RepID=W9KW93_FUSOX|nr:uncharacterized protein FOBCDRAFT_198962 [Fusarium oxysporum Fo47]EWZ45378.1 hypothetical protein FOZG_05726 [Fusarium oxysporum Fo47]QKD51615.2 hypothetical protein FOBCDRAFT_198962 [Fusarium oxysporum Fo47]
MVGRPRRASTSSVDTEDESQRSWKQEKSVLRFDPGGVDPDTTFEIKDAVVLNKDGHTLENALDVATRGPYIIRGLLHIEEQSQRARLIMKVRSLTPFEVRKCGQFSIGESDSGSPVIWMLGTCGWFELNAAPAYLPIYRKMQEAIRLYYRLMAIYRDKKPKKAKKSKKDALKELYQVFHEYAASIGDGSTLEEVIARCDDHASFLIAQCIQDQSEVEWFVTPFYKWLINRHQDLYNKELERMNNPPQPQRSPSVEASNPPVSQILTSRTRNGSSAPSTARDATPDIIEPEDSPPRRRYSRSRSATHRPENSVVDLFSSTQISRDGSTRPVSAHSSASIPSVRMSQAPISVDAEDDAFRTVLDALEWIRVEISNSKGGRLNISAVANKFWSNFRFPTYKGDIKPSYRVPIQEVLHYNVHGLLQVLDKDKYDGEFYSWLQELAEMPFNPVAIKPSEFPFYVIRRKPSSNNNPSKPAPPSQAGAASRNLDEGFSTPPRSSPAGKSLMRPGRPSGIKSSLRLATTSKKRPHSEVDSDSEDEGSELKRSHYFSGEEETMGNTSHMSLSEDEDAQETSEGPVKIFLRADNIPTTVPRGPGETWVCEEEDCGYVVRGGDIQNCRDRIRRHFNEHEQQMDRVNLARTEATRGHLPVKYAYFPPFLILVELHPPCITQQWQSPPVDQVATAASTPTLANSPVAPSLQPRTPESSPTKTPALATRRGFRSIVDGFRRRAHPVSDNIDKLTF